VAGWLACAMSSSSGKVLLLEGAAVGAFGAVIGAELLAAFFQGDKPAPGVTIGGVLAAVAGAVLMLTLLKLMRGVVGPMRTRKSPAARRR